jgi:hypothetical protein
MCGDCGGCGVYMKSPHFVVYNSLYVCPYYTLENQPFIMYFRVVSSILSCYLFYSLQTIPCAINTGSQVLLYKFPCVGSTQEVELIRNQHTNNMLPVNIN